jgi:EAL domain-containing protein (putative c-di-GMP-specific phosphodiesterase class I)
MAKEEGRGTFRFFEPELDARARNRHALEQDLRGAVARAEFALQFQPKIGVATGEVSGFEALLRWHHPERGTVSPAEFIPVAEECGLIVPIGAWVLAHACLEAASWPDHVHLAVNLSPVQIGAPGLLDTVRRALAGSGLPARRLELEITETVLLHKSAATLAVLYQLRDLGIAIAMDDFGTGYSSLSYLRQFPFDRIKIDRSFVQDLTLRDDARFVVRAVVGLCANLGIKTTAEGVETHDQLQILRDEGCTEVQGYLLGRPQPADSVAHLLAATTLAASAA